MASDRLVRRNLALELEALRRPFVEPGEEHREGKADDGSDHDPAHHPFRDVKQRKDLGCDLHEQPRARCVERRRADDIATLQFRQEGGFVAHGCAGGTGNFSFWQRAAKRGSVL